MSTIGFGITGWKFRVRKDTDDSSMDQVTLLERLSSSWPQSDFVVFGPSVGRPVDRPNVYYAWELYKPSSYESTLRAATLALAGCDNALVFLSAHTSVSLNGVVNKLDGSGTVSSLVSAQTTTAPLVAALNAWQDADPEHEPTYVCVDSRNLLQARDIKWPPRFPILAQWSGERVGKHFRYGDPRSPEECLYNADWYAGHENWSATHRYQYVSLELIADTLTRK